MINERVIDIVEEYLLNRTKGEIIPTRELRRRLTRTRVTEEDVDQILLELKDEWDREEMNQTMYKKAKSDLIFGLSMAVGLIILTLFFASQQLTGGVTIVFYGVIASGFLMAYRGYSQIKKSKLVKERREIKWRRYDIKSRT